MISAAEAQELYTELRHISAAILKAYGCDTEPHRPVARTKRWRHGKPRGIGYHYTAGTSTAGAMKWGNKPAWGNTGSAWHALIADRILDEPIGELWVKMADKALRALFPVPTIITANFRWGTWHGNWTNDMTLGVENRNAGYGGKVEDVGRISIVDGEGEISAHVKMKNGKPAVAGAGKVWEHYSREQLAANVSFGRMVNALFGLDPDWILSHQCFWATKSDTGPLYPIHQVRSAIFDTSLEVDQLDWLGQHPMAPDTNEDDDERWYSLGEDGTRGEREFVTWALPKPDVHQVVDDAWIAEHLYKLGFNAGPEVPTPDVLKKMVRWFQRSTAAYKYAKRSPSSWALVPDGIVGPLTQAGLERRVEQLTI